MELWIRSQDKTSLEKVDSIEIYEQDNGCCRINDFGFYETKERALEVLDEIQHLLSPMLIFKNCNCTKEMLENIKEAGTCVVSDNAHIEQIQTCIYEMPEE